MKNHAKVLQAVMKREISAVENALDEGGNVDEIDRDGRTPLFEAVTTGLIEIVLFLIERGANVNFQDAQGRVPLHFAVNENQVDVAKMLIRHGANVNAQDNNGNSVLCDAVFASQGRPEMIKLLLDNGADKDLKNNYGVSPEELAKSISNYDIPRYLKVSEN